MTVHVLPCGTSILRNLQPPFDAAGPLRAQVRDLTDWARRELAAAGRADPRAWAAALDDAIADVRGPLRAAQNPVALSAELAGLDRHVTRPADTDRIVLLASDTADGVLSAILVGVALNRPIDYYPAPVRNNTDRPCPVLTDPVRLPVDLIRIEGLLPDSTARFEGAMAQLGSAMAWAARLDRSAPLVIHLSGGYKATIPYLVTLTEYLAKAWPPVEAWCLHEGDDANNPDPQPLRIRLRSVDLAADLRAVSLAARGEHPGGRLLDFAYTTDNAGAVHLTPLGHGLAALLPGLLELLDA
ncbi:conserved hypothetical protein [Frankia canadensis]|uniref:CRISPR system ring nuclease SSO1393-like domain-containing protein n=1 Tax=Frankia canadensis TaxID=1836972 RepID=A0A2I2KVK9_9ACTN|nr:hypothetical protein [Frankia canadensis]SNQ49707.1 conserved hypothetical protein [Frankia canadensis]SOU56997.1 conserved hypothetical protein [Frankia canadensis]